jgi:adenosylcobyric acid synthase
MAKYPLYYQSNFVAGTHVHGIFDHDAFRTDYFKAIHPKYQGYRYSHYREAEIQGFADMVEENLDMDAILRPLQAD